MKLEILGKFAGSVYMAMMSKRERIKAVLAGKPVDRVPHANLMALKKAVETVGWAKA